MNERARSGPIVLTTRTLDSKSGTSQAALDVALALSQRASLLRIRAWVPNPLPREIDGRMLGAWQWEPVSPLTAADAVGDGEAPPRALYEHARNLRAWARTRLSGRAPASLEVVNGLGAHALYAAERLPDTPSVLIVHESPRHFETAQRLSFEQAALAMRTYDYRVFVSERGQKEWQTLAGLDPERSLYIPNCVREQRVVAAFSSARAELRRRFGYDAHGVHAVCVGQVSLRKGQDSILAALQAMPALPNNTPPMRLDFLGASDSPWARELIAQYAGTPLAPNIRFLGNVRDVYERVYAADVLVLGSRAEAFPLVVLEAMALGVCVVAPDIDGVREQVIDESTGLLFARDNARELVGCLSRVARDGRLRERFGAAGRARYLERFTRERQLARWSSALQWMRGGS